MNQNQDDPVVVACRTLIEVTRDLIKGIDESTLIKKYDGQYIGRSRLRTVRGYILELRRDGLLHERDGLIYILDIAPGENF